MCRVDFVRNDKHSFLHDESSSQLKTVFSQVLTFFPKTSFSADIILSIGFKQNLSIPKMSIYKMNKDQIMKFVQLYKDCECLWDINSTGYKDRNKRDAALQHMSEKMDITGFGHKEVAQKIKNVRTTYKQELQKIMKSTTASAPDIYKPKVPWFYSLDSFLRCLYNIPTLSNLQDKGHMIKRSTFPASDNNEIRKEKTMEPERSLKNNTGQESLSQHNSHKRRRFHLKKPRAPIYAFQTLDKFNNTQKTGSDSETEFDIWARSLAVQFNNMEICRAIRLQLQIQTIVSKERLEYEKNKKTQITVAANL